MVNVINANSSREFNALLYPDQNPFHADYFQSQVTSFNQALTDYGQKFVASAKQLYDKVNDSAAIALARRAISSAKGIFNTNLITRLSELTQVQNAQPGMIRWVMACPDIRELYQKQLCDGYSGIYADVQPGTIAETHDDYRKVMSGIVVEDEHDWHVNTYFDDIQEGDRELTSFEQFDIIDTWDIARAFIKSGEDPTNPFGGKL